MSLYMFFTQKFLMKNILNDGMNEVMITIGNLGTSDISLEKMVEQFITLSKNFHIHEEGQYTLGPFVTIYLFSEII